MPVPANRILDLATGIGQVQTTTLFQVLDQDLNVKGEVKSLTPCSITASTGAQIKRQLSGFTLNEEDLNAVNMFTDRIKVSVILEDGTEWPQGVYVFTDSAKKVGTYMTTLSTSLMDQDYILSQGTEFPYGVNPGGSIVQAIEFILDESNIWTRDVPGDASVRVGDPLNWPPGTARAAMLKVLCDLAGWLPPYFDNNGVCIIRPPTDINNTEPDHYYDTERVAYNTLTENENLLQAANTYIVISTGPSKGEISARAEVDASLPFSVPNRGFVIPSVHRTQGLTSTRQAQEMADALAQAGSTGFKNVFFTGPPDPRHDLFQTVEFNGDVYNEVEWTLPLKGAAHTHSLTLGGFIKKE
jgi:hypothetical protein